MKAVLIVLLFLTVATPAAACSLSGCLAPSVELRSTFAVRVTYAGNALPGVGVQIRGLAQNGAPQVWYRLTAADGAAQFANLSPGDYSIQAELLGIWAGYECFHINTAPTRKAKTRRNFEWGNMPFGVYQPAGRIVESRPGNEGNPVQRLLHRIEVPVTDAKLELRSPGGAIYQASSDWNGRFAFAKVLDGVYVLHIEGGNDTVDTDDILVRVGYQNKPFALLITRRDAGAGSCGGAAVQIVDSRGF